ncbi:MAG: TIGR02996 domain-containing protein, partial [Gemmataceae bacterium]|nr:TIGR02996 domain-containing protein [Gemmataceae bacterium]
MSSHPDADAFVRAFLRNPQDETARLVFADWLEDTGEPQNAAWAGYIRAKAAAARHEFGSPEWRRSDDEAAGFAADVRANLTLPVGFFLNYPASLLRLLPGPNTTVWLGEVELLRTVIEFVPESVARENLVLPLQMQGLALLMAAAYPDSRDLLDKLEFVLGRTVVAVRAEPDALQTAIDTA